ncbi:PREDICTED: saccharopine dehydrogenase-like oxidoreductase [Haliaeetus leucocephalus]|uniref:saccharopine dehydrogenase-like oxidoreductase n=1 Tax=Haliaeetus leucocephalus TaxID=52644 RepID=UPI00053CB7FD|nr:PREDICTED: saccharopine dehydrogenase-like oxidoreductase [Haliaeetus leucocephalus]
MASPYKPSSLKLLGSKAPRPYLGTLLVVDGAQKAYLEIGHIELALVVLPLERNRVRQSVQQTASSVMNTLGELWWVGFIFCYVWWSFLLQYRFFGEPVVEACVENGASCIDICGEPQFLEGMYLKYNEKAAEKGVYVIGSCGFDSIPADMGVLYTRDKLKGTLTAVESFLKVKSGPEGSCAHDGTWKSAVYGLADQDNLRKLRKKIGYAPVPVVGAKLKSRGLVFYNQQFKEYSIRFMGSDGSVVKRSQCYLHTELQETPVQYGAYVNIGGLGSVIKLMFAGILFLLLVKFSFGRKLLTKYPEFFSAGFFTKKGPTQKQMDGTSFTMTFFGEGYSEGQDPQYGKPNVKICTEVKGPEPGYVATPIAMVQAAVSLLEDAACLPKRGGVYSPGAAFSKTKLIDHLNKRGVEFSVISKPEL